MQQDNFTLWEDAGFKVITLSNPHTPKKEGAHLVVLPKKEIVAAWEDVKTSGEVFVLASKVCKTLKRLNLGDWFNIQANGNWGLLPGKKPSFHVHIYARIKGSDSWGKPVQLPDLPGTFQNEPLAQKDISLLVRALAEDL
ncbi:MAG: hypothetical protein KBD27_02050 [Candidatus Moranbacteria bacterium]|nr:hypothetical protein [Candidatus Moranbacteria bacterium]